MNRARAKAAVDNRSPTTKMMNAELEKLVEQITDMIVARLQSEQGSDNNIECSPHHIACALQASYAIMVCLTGRKPLPTVGPFTTDNNKFLLNYTMRMPGLYLVPAGFQP